MNVQCSKRPCKAVGVLLTLCAPWGPWEVCQPGHVIGRFVFWKDNSGML